MTRHWRKGSLALPESQQALRVIVRFFSMHLELPPQFQAQH
ncbi:hypothetical protein [Xanthomonas prunicola]|nr:hypothetical protein [Xanthomonas prunicola]